MPTRRLCAEDYWQLRKISKRVQTATRKIKEWVDAFAAAHGIYPDQVGVNTGAIYDDQGVQGAHVLSRMTFAEYGAIRELISRVEMRQDELQEHLDRAAKALNTTPDLIDLRSGEVKMPDGPDILSKLGLDIPGPVCKDTTTGDTQDDGNKR